MNLKELEAIQVLLQHSKLGWASINGDEGIAIVNEFVKK